MSKTILITGATDGIGRAAARQLLEAGHTVLFHGRDAAKLADIRAAYRAQTYQADLSDLNAVVQLAEAILTDHARIDVLINNAGVLKTLQSRTASGPDVRFVVNTIAPYLLTKKLLDCMDAASRIINIASAAQAPVDLEALTGHSTMHLEDMSVYSQSKLALIAWSNHMAGQIPAPMICSVNPGSLLATKMVKEGFGIEGQDLSLGANILCSAATEERFAKAHGCYYDTDSQAFADPHPDTLSATKAAAITAAIETVLSTQRLA